MSRLGQIADLEKRFLLPTYNRYPVGFERGKGVFLYDFEGKKYLDFVAGLGVNALGHAHPRIVKIIRAQAARVIHVSNLYYNEYQGQLAERLCQLSGLDRVFFSNSGTEAMEGAIKLARLAGHRAGGDAKSQLVALQGSYHGRTFGAMSLTGQDKYRKGFEPLLEDVTFVAQNDVEALRAAVNANTCAIVLEPIFGEGGVLECSEDFLRACRTLADHRQADRRRSAARRVPVERTFRLRDFARTARHHFWRRSAGMPRWPRISGHRRRRASARKRGEGRQLPAATTPGTGRQVRGYPRSARPRIHSGPRTRHPRAPIGGAGSGGGRALQRDPGHGPALPAVVHAGRKARR